MPLNRAAAVEYRAAEAYYRALHQYFAQHRSKVASRTHAFTRNNPEVWEGMAQAAAPSFTSDTYIKGLLYE